MTQHKLVNGLLVELTADEIAAREAEAVTEHNKRIVQHLPAYRWLKENGGVTVGEVHIQTDERARANLLGAKALGTSVQWKTLGGFVTLTAEQVTAIATAVGVHVQKCFAAEAAVADTINNLETIEGVEQAFDTAYEGE